MGAKERLIEELAKKYGVPEKDVEKAVKSQFKALHKEMAKEDFPEIRLPFFGVFKAKPSRIKHLNNYKNKDENNK
jgi:nucleoid DNA-binding protein